MLSKKTITLNGENLTVEDIYNIVKTPDLRIQIDENALKAVRKSREFVDSVFKELGYE